MSRCALSGQRGVLPGILADTPALIEWLLPVQKLFLHSLHRGLSANSLMVI